MVRVGGGWKSLDHFLLVHDPCRIEEVRLCELHFQASLAIMYIMELARMIGSALCIVKTSVIGDQKWRGGGHVDSSMIVLAIIAL